MAARTCHSPRWKLGDFVVFASLSSKEPLLSGLTWDKIRLQLKTAKVQRNLFLFLFLLLLFIFTYHFF